MLFAVEYALAQLLMHWGIRPQVMLGYSLGEYVAACLAGATAEMDLSNRRASVCSSDRDSGLSAKVVVDAAARLRRHLLDTLLGEGRADLRGIRLRGAVPVATYAARRQKQSGPGQA